MIAEIQGFSVDLLGEAWHILPYFLLGIAIGAVIRTFRLHVRMRDSLGTFGVWVIPGAIVVGVISPLCSCGAIPLFVSLVSSGVPLSAALTLLLVSPLMSPSGYTITAGLLGIPWANLKLLCAVLMGAFCGTTIWLMERGGLFPREGLIKFAGKVDIHADDCPGELHCHCGDQWSNRLGRAGHGNFVIFFAKAWELTLKTGKFTLIGLVVSVVAARYLPREWVSAVLGGGGFLRIIGVTLASAFLHVNEITAAQILYSISDMGVGKGPALAFLIGGPVTSMPAMAVLWTMCRPRVVATFVAIALIGTVVLAVALQAATDLWPSAAAIFQFKG